MTKLFVQNATYLGDAVELLVEDGCVVELAKQGALQGDVDGAEIFDAAGLLLFPSFFDCHVHLREPGYEYKEDIASGLKAAAHGGFGGVMCMANTKPVNDDATVTRFIIETGLKHWPHGPFAYPVGAATIGLKGVELAPMAELAEAGCVAFSNDGAPVPNTEIFRRAMEYASDLDRVLIDHCEDPYLAKGAHMNEGVTSGRIGIKGQPDVGEALHVARDIMLADYLGIPVHLAHISCRRSVEHIAWAKERGIPVTAETCPHYLLLDESILEGYDANCKVNPPLRTPDDVQAMREAVANGTIDMFVTDHAPHAAHEKETPLDEAPNGFTGLDLAVSLTWGFVRDGLINEADFLRMWNTAPAAVFNLPHNSFNVGDRADFFLFDPAEKWVANRDTMQSKSLNTPFLNTEMVGRVKHHWMHGVKIV